MNHELINETVTSCRGLTDRLKKHCSGHLDNPEIPAALGRLGVIQEKMDACMSCLVEITGRDERFDRVWNQRAKNDAQVDFGESIENEIRIKVLELNHDRAVLALFDMMRSVATDSPLGETLYECWVEECSESAPDAY